MAHFISMPLPGDKGGSVVVNVEAIKYMRPSSAQQPERTTLYFDGEHSLVVEMQASIISDRANKG